LREYEDEFIKRNVKVVVVTFENDFFAQSYVAETRLAWPLLVDDCRDTYRNYGMLSASFWDVWGPRTWWAYLRALLKGQTLQKSKGDIFQRGGDVLIDPAGIVRLHHIGEGPADRPPVEVILKRMAL
jgi:AhpC/TSA antioxidant enzyme